MAQNNNELNEKIEEVLKDRGKDAILIIIDLLNETYKIKLDELF